jgi:hypothetical protein
MTIHYTVSVDNKATFCGTKVSEKTSLTTDKDTVTCKRCLKKLNAPTKVKVAKKDKVVSKGKGNVEYVEHEKHGHCLSIGRGTLLRVGKKLDEKVGTMILGSELGMMSTSMKFAGDVGQLISENEITFLKKTFSELKKAGNGVVLVSDVKNAFTVTE